MLVQAALVTQEQHLLALAGEVERILEQHTFVATATKTNRRVLPGSWEVCAIYVPCMTEVEDCCCMLGMLLHVVYAPPGPDNRTLGRSSCIRWESC